LLRQAQQRYPADLSINYELAFEILSRPPTTMAPGPNRRRGDDECVGYLRVALAARPENPEILRSLGSALADSGHFEEAAAMLQHAIQLKPTAWTYLRLGVALFGKRDFDGAVAAYNQSLRLAPKQSLAYVGLGEIYWAKGARDEARKAYRTALQMAPGLASTVWGYGRFFLEQDGDQDRAVDAYRQSIELDPQHADQMLPSVLQLGIGPDWAASFRKAIELHPDKAAWGRLGLGRILQAKGDLDGAVAAYREACKLDPRLTDAFWRLGETLWAKSDKDGAVAAYRQAIEADPKRAFDWAGPMHRIQQTGGDLDWAAAAYRKAIELHPDKAAWGHLGLGRILHLKKDLDGAVEAYRKAVKLDPMLTYGFWWLGNVLWAKDDRNGAAAAYREAARLPFRTVEDIVIVHLDLASALRAVGDLEGAVAACRKVVDELELVGRQAGPVLQRYSPLVSRELELTLRALGERDGAGAADQKAIVTLKEPPALNEFAWFLATSSNVEDRNPARAVVLARKAVELAPKEASYYNTLGVAQYRAGDEKAALAALHRSMELTGGGDAADWLFLAMAHHKLGDREEARKWYDKAAAELEKNGQRLSPADAAEARRFRTEAEELLGLKKK
jgi:superkiller protein 3